MVTFEFGRGHYRALDEGRGWTWDGPARIEATLDGLMYESTSSTSLKWKKEPGNVEEERCAWAAKQIRRLQRGG